MKRDDFPLYIAGPMTGIPAFNYPAFDAAALALREAGYFIVSPSEIGDPALREAALRSPDGNAKDYERQTGMTYTDFLVRNTRVVADQVRGLVLLPGWDRSIGTKTELWVAGLFGLPAFTYPNMVEIEFGFELHWHTRTH